MLKLDELMVEKKVVAMFVDVIPRNTSAINYGTLVAGKLNYI